MLICTVAAYLTGSLPFAVWIGKGFYSKDIREIGSGNPGATNAWRVFGWKVGLPVLLLDIGKGLAATGLPLLFSSLTPEADLLLWVRIHCGIAVAAGHIYPLFAGFRGGKAVATLFGAILGLMPLPASLSLGVFLVVVLVFRYVSIGSIGAGISLPIFGFFMTDHPYQLLVISLMVTVLVLVTHMKNIGRLAKGEESRLNLRSRSRER